MRRKFTFLLAALLLMSGLSWAQTRTEEVTYILDGSITGGSNGYATESEITQNGITWMVTGNTMMSPWRIGGKNLTNENRPLYSTVAISDNITKVVVTNGTATCTVNSMTLIVSANADFSNPTSTISGVWAASSTTLFERPANVDWSNMYFKLVYNVTAGSSNQYAQFVKAEFYKELDASAPFINAEDVEIAYNATSGAIAYTIDNPAGGTLTANTTSDWLTLGTAGTATVPFTCTANSTGVARTATVTLTYTYNTDQTVAKNITVTQAANPNAVDNISDITAAGTYSVQGTIVAKGARGFIVGDGTGYVYYYNQNYTQADYNIGDMVKLSGSVVVYGGVFEFNSSTTITTATSSNYVSEDPTVLTGADMDARVASTTPPDLSNYVQYEGTLSVSGTHYNINIADATTALGSISYPLNVNEITALDGKQVKVTGYYVGISTSTYYNTMLGSIEEVVAAVATPTFNPEAGIYEEAQNVTISCTTPNVNIYYTIDGTDPDDESIPYSDPITVSTTTTIKAIAFDADDNASAIATATYTIIAPLTIAQARAQGTGDVITMGTVTSFSVNNSNKTTAYIQDATAAIVVFGEFTVAVGDEIRVSGTLSDYNGLLEIINPEVTIISSSNTVNPQLMTIAEVVASTNQGWYIRVEGATVTAISGQNTTIAQGENTIVVRGISGVEYAVNDVLSLNGNIGYYNGNQIAHPTNVEVQANTEPAILLDTYAIEVPAEGGEGDINVTYQNLEVSAEYLAVVFFDENEDYVDPDIYDWITVEIDVNYNVHYVVDANQGAARMAYFKVNYSYFEPEDFELKSRRDGLWVPDYYSDLVTVSQEAYVAPTYAELPFEFDGGRADIAETDGLYQEGLGGDYSNSPKLKFDGAGDYLLLQFNEEPGTLTFDIKGNPGGNPSVWAGTFKVQTSVDGETYTDLGIYTNLTTTVQSESFDLSEDVRYIKWIYEEKSSGNVALGNIHLYELGGGPVTEYDLTIEPFENLEIFTFVGGDENNPFEGAGTIQVTVGDQVMLSIAAIEGYVIQSLMVDGVEHVNDITADATYTFTMPDHNVTISATAVEDIPFEPATYTLITSEEQIEPGKTYIIVGSKEIEGETYYYAMGEQRNNNRGGVAISVDGTTATVGTPEVHEFVIDYQSIEDFEEFKYSGGNWTGVAFYSIYDTNEALPGYLYAASSTANQLKTESELDENGIWVISNDSIGQFFIAAQGSNTRNVMQFNYNNNNPTIFSCYSSTTTADVTPVYLYVKDETTTTVTQTITLSAGTNWISSYVEVELTDLQTALTDVLGTSNVTITISSQTDNSTLKRGRWTGQLTSLDLTQMYTVEVPSACEITLEGMPIDPAQLTLNISFGENWIAFPFAENMALADAFAGFAASNDVVSSQTENATYRRNKWTGTLSTLEPGQGYIYSSVTNGTQPFVYPTANKSAKGGAKPATMGLQSLSRKAEILSNFKKMK